MKTILCVKHSQALDQIILVVHVINIVEYCHNQLNNDNVIAFIALEFQKAFDVLNHVILCEKLKLYGCNDNRAYSEMVQILLK